MHDLVIRGASIVDIGTQVPHGAVRGAQPNAGA
jgi:hypothetical protein